MNNLEKYINLSPMLILATIDENWFPYTSNVYFKYDWNLKFYFCSNQKRNHSKHITKNWNIAWSILNTQKYSLKDTDKKWLQFQWNCKVLIWEEKSEIHNKYFQEFDSLTHMNEINQEIYECIPKSVKVWDEEIYSGWKIIQFQ